MYICTDSYVTTKRFEIDGVTELFKVWGSARVRRAIAPLYYYLRSFNKQTTTTTVLGNENVTKQKV